jgi:fructose-bisphosphate aldolase class 1
LSPTEVACLAIQTLKQSAPTSVPGIIFLNVGLSKEDSTIFLNSIDNINRVEHWPMTFSFCCANHSSALKV